MTNLLSSFGHRVYKNYDPRARIVKKVADEVFEVVGKEPLVEIAMELEQIALKDQYFIDRKLYPNVDFYSGVIYRAMGFPTDFFVCLFMIPVCFQNAILITLLILFISAAFKNFPCSISIFSKYI